MKLSRCSNALPLRKFCILITTHKIPCFFLVEKLFYLGICKIHLCWVDLTLPKIIWDKRLEANIFLLQKTLHPYLFTGYKLAIQVISSQITGAIACTSTCAELQRYDHHIVTLKTSYLALSVALQMRNSVKDLHCRWPSGRATTL